MDKPPIARLRLQVVGITATRTVVTTGYRMIYAFLPVIARGLGVDLAAIALVVTARSSVALVSPFLGSLSDVRGRRAGMLLGLGVVAAGLAAVAFWPSYPMLFAGLLIAAAGRYMLDTSAQAFLGDQVDYRQRGLAVALSESSWSLSFLVGIPIIGWVIARGGWSDPFAWLAGLAGLAGLGLWRLLPRGTPRQEDRPHLGQTLRTVIVHPYALAGLAVSLLISTSNQMVNIVYGAWLEGSFHLPVAELGVAAMVIGLAELGGEGLVAGLTDRLGKRRAVSLGIAVNVVAGLALPLLGQGLAGGLVGLFLFYLSFEFTLVSGFALFTELLPGARATLLASCVTVNELGRALGALLGPQLFAWGLLANGAAAAVLDIVALVVLLRWVRVE